MSCPSEQTAQMFRHSFNGTPALVVSGLAELENAVFQTIVCSPPISQSSRQSEGADGFGSEVIRLLRRYLATNGTLIWITGRAALSNGKFKKTLVSLGNEGLHPFATIEIPPGGGLNMTIAGAAIVFREASPNTRLVGVLPYIRSTGRRWTNRQMNISKG
jgi:hypothetical protein